MQSERRARWGNYTLEDDDGPTSAVGTDAYKAYMTAFVAAHPDQIVDSMEQIPDVDVDAIPEHPNLADIT